MQYTMPRRTAMKLIATSIAGLSTPVSGALEKPALLKNKLYIYNKNKFFWDCPSCLQMEPKELTQIRRIFNGYQELEINFDPFEFGFAVDVKENYEDVKTFDIYIKGLIDNSISDYFNPFDPNKIDWYIKWLDKETKVKLIRKETRKNFCSETKDFKENPSLLRLSFQTETKVKRKKPQFKFDFNDLFPADLF